MALFQKKYLKYPLCWLLIFSFLFQAFPAPAKASPGLLDSVLKWIGELIGKVPLPKEIKITEKGDLVAEGVDFMDWKGIIWRCMAEDKKGKCKNPFSLIDLRSLLGLGDKPSPALARGEIPEVCELRIITPQEEQMLSQRERLDLYQICRDFRNIKRAAAKEAYFAKRIFNNTDPLSECLFVKNCRSSCHLRFGKFAYRVSIFEILTWLGVPGSWITGIKKIFDIASKVYQVYSVIEMVQTTFKSGVKTLNQFFQQTSYLANLYKAFEFILTVDSENSFEEALEHYSNNVLKYNRAKSQALLKTRECENVVGGLMNILKEEPGVNFLFTESSTARTDLQGIINNYGSNFQTPEQIVARLAGIGKFLREEENQYLFEYECKQISCPPPPLRACTYECLVPVNNWFDMFREISDTAQDLKRGVELSDPVFVRRLKKRFEEDTRWINDRKEDLSVELRELPQKDGETQYWETVEIKSPGIPIRYHPDIVYFLWEGTVKIITNTELQAMIDALEDPDFDPEKFYEFYQTPVINFKLDKIENILAEAKKIIKDARKDADNKAAFDEATSTIESLELTIGYFKPSFPYLNQLWAEAGVGEMSPTKLLIDFVEKIIETKTISQEIATSIGEAEPLFDGLIALGDSLLEDPGLSSETRAKLREIFGGWISEWSVPGAAWYDSAAVAGCSEETSGTCDGRDCPCAPACTKKARYASASATMNQWCQEQGYDLASTYVCGSDVTQTVAYYDGSWQTGTSDITCGGPPYPLVCCNTGFVGCDEFSNPTKNGRKLGQKMITQRADRAKFDCSNKELTGKLEEVSQILLTGPNSVKSFVGTYECPGEGFLAGIKCFEEAREKTFEDILVFLENLSKLETIMEKLYEIKKTIPLLKPEIRMAPLQLKTDVDLTQIGKDLLNNKPVSFDIFKGESPGSFGEFAEGVFRNPISYLEGQFETIENNISTINDIALNQINPFEIPFEDVSQGQYFSNELNSLGSKTLELSRVVSGDEALRQGCKNLSFVLKQNPEELRRACKDKAEGGEIDNEFLNDEQINEDCEAIDQVGIGFLKENFETTYEECIAEVEEYRIKQTEYCLFSVPIEERAECLEKLAKDLTQMVKACELLELFEEWEDLEAKLKICNEWAYQKALKRDCDEFYYWGKVLQNKCSDLAGQCIDLKGRCGNDETCQDHRAALIAWFQNQIRPDLQDSSNQDVKDFILGFPDDDIPDLSIREELLREEKIILNLIREETEIICDLKTDDIKTPLEDIMRIYSILIGIRSGTLFYRGISSTKESIQEVIANTKALIAMIEALPKQLKESSGKELEDSGTGLSWEIVNCEALPAESRPEGRRNTGPQGGGVCPKIKPFFSMIDSQFSLMRYNLNRMDEVRRIKKWAKVTLTEEDLSALTSGWLQLGSLALAVGTDVLGAIGWSGKIPGNIKKGLKYTGWGIFGISTILTMFKIKEIKAALFPYFPLKYKDPSKPAYIINELYDEAKKIERKARIVWALATAVDFANQNCTCGKSYCNMPLCISGAPLTLDPLKEPYCYLVYTLRYPLKKYAEKLERALGATEYLTIEYEEEVPPEEPPPEEPPPEEPEWLEGFSYRREIAIDNTWNINNLNDYQTSLNFDTQSLISEGKMQSDCSDLRLTDSDGKTLLNYWLESGCNSAETKIWLKVPFIANYATKTIYLYYGNPSALGESDMEKVFLRIIDGIQPVKLSLHLDEEGVFSCQTEDPRLLAANDEWCQRWVCTPKGYSGAQFIPVKSERWSYGCNYYCGSNTSGNMCADPEGSEEPVSVGYCTCLDGTTAYDTSGNENDGVISGATWTSGKYGRALQFFGEEEDYLDAGTASTLDISGEISLEAWVYRQGDGVGGFPGIIGKYNLGGGYLLNYRPPADKVEFYLRRDSGTYQYISSNNDLPLNQWVHIVALKDATDTMKMYINNTLQSKTATFSDPYSNSSASLYLGRETINYFTGLIDEARVYNRALTEEEIEDLYNNYGYTTEAAPGMVLIRQYSDPEPPITVGPETGL